MHVAQARHVDAEAPVSELAAQVAGHLQITEDHDRGAVPVELDTRDLLEPAILDNARNTSAKGTRERLPRDDWHVSQPVR